MEQEYPWDKENWRWKETGHRYPRLYGTQTYHQLPKLVSPLGSAVAARIPVLTNVESVRQYPVFSASIEQKKYGNFACSGAFAKLNSLSDVSAASGLFSSLRLAAVLGVK
jgi:hypothetical protein